MNQNSPEPANLAPGGWRCTYCATVLSKRRSPSWWAERPGGRSSYQDILHGYQICLTNPPKIYHSINNIYMESSKIGGLVPVYSLVRERRRGANLAFDQDIARFARFEARVVPLAGSSLLASQI